MARHDVRLVLPPLSLGIVDADFIVKKDGKPFGTLKISQGAVVWLPAFGVNHRRIAWKALADFIEENGKVISKVKKKAPAKKTVTKKTVKRNIL